MRTFVFPAAMAACVLLARTAGAQDEIGKRERAKIEIQWAERSSKHYTVNYESIVPVATVKQVEEALEDVLAVYVSVFKFEPKEKFKIKFLDNPNTYEQEGGDPSHPGHFNPRTEELVIQQMPFFDLLPTVYHEAFHQYFQAHIGKDVPIPTWFNEGLAQYFEGIKKNKQTKKLDSKLIDNRKMTRLKEALFTRSALPLEKLVDATYEEFHDKEKEELHYSQSFAFLYFVMQAMGVKPASQVAEELKKTKDVKAAMDKLFGKGRKNLKAMERKWKEYVLALKIDEA
jgi:hypothetical protein